MGGKHTEATLAVRALSDRGHDRLQIGRQLERLQRCFGIAALIRCRRRIARQPDRLVEGDQPGVTNRQVAGIDQQMEQRAVGWRGLSDRRDGADEIA